MATTLLHLSKVHVRRGMQTVLIDDDRRNIDVGLQHGVAALWFNPAEGQGGDRALLDDMMKLD